MAAPKANYNLQDEGLHGWEFHVDFKEWDNQVILDWIDMLDDEFGADHEEKFNVQSITGQHFTRNQLGNAQWCHNELGMDVTTANSFSAIVRQRITKYENIMRDKANNQNEPHIVLKDVKLIPSPQAQKPAQNNQAHKHNHNHNIGIPQNRNPNHNLNNNNGVLGQLGSPLQQQSPHHGPLSGSPLQQAPNQFGFPPNNPHQYQGNDLKQQEQEQKPPLPAFYVKTITPGPGAGGTSNSMGEPQAPSNWQGSLHNLPPGASPIQPQVSLEVAEHAVNRALSVQHLPSKPPVKASGSFGPQAQQPPLVRTDISHSAPIQPAQVQDLGPPPDLPFTTHPPPSNKSMSNKFRENGPNKLMYPPKNGPIAIAKRLGLSIHEIPAFDPDDEISGDASIITSLSLQYANQLSQLSLMGYLDHNKNLRCLLRCSGDINGVIDEYLNVCTQFDSIYIGDRVVRGADWKWGDQDGGLGNEGTVRGLRQWHPLDAENSTTEVVILWDHGLYGNYRFGYKSAYDIRVVDRCIMDDEKHDKVIKKISVGDKVCRAQMNWRWGSQDIVNNHGGIGTVIELYASPAPFEGGARIAVLWDHAKQYYRNKAEEYIKLHPHGDDEWYDNDNDNDNNDGDEEKQAEENININAQQPGCIHNEKEILIKYKQFVFKQNVHRVRKKRKKYVKCMASDDGSSDEHSSEWDEPDFDEILCKPIAKYRWCLPDPKSAYGTAQDLEISESIDIPDRRYLMIDDRVRKSVYFKAKRKEAKSMHGIVLKVEQSDPRRVNPNQIRGDKVYTTWSSHQSYKFQCDNGTDDVIFFKRGQIFRDKWSRIKVGDRVKRGVTWLHNKYGVEDGGHEKKGTVTCVQYVLQVSGILVKVKWENNNHIDFYSWGFKDIYDIRKI